MTFGILIASVTTLSAAVITGIFVLGAKAVGVRSTVAQGHAESRVEGYNLVLAAFDAKWYWVLSNWVRGKPDDTDELEADSERWTKALIPLTQKGLDQLEAHCHDFETIQMAVTYIDGITSGMLPDVTVEHYEQARKVLVDCQRRDTGLAEALKLGGVKRWPKKLAALRESVKPPPTRMEKLWQQARAAGVEGVIVMDDGSAIREWLERYERQREELEAGLAIAKARVESWHAKGLWTGPMPNEDAEPDD